MSTLSKSHQDCESLERLIQGIFLEDQRLDQLSILGRGMINRQQLLAALIKFIEKITTAG
jgi:hypothetical protein